MENAVNKFAETIRTATVKCLEPGPERPPNTLLGLLENHEDPIKALSDVDTGNEIFEALLSEFEFLRRLRAGNGVISDTELSQYICLLRWLSQQLIAWKEEHDTRHRKLTACFVTAQVLCQVDSIWELFPIQIANNMALLGFLATRIPMYKANLVVRAPRHASENKILDEFKTADSEGDWPTIGELLPHLDHMFDSNVFLTQSVHCLFQFAFGNLVAAVSGVSQINVALEIARALSIPYGLQLAAASTNTYAQFAAVWETSGGQLKKHPLTDIENRALQNIFNRIASDHQRWVLWMRCFNRYPARYPAIQIALGRFLASANEAVLTAYFESISLNCGILDNRQAVANCMQAFRALASQTNRKFAWTLAFNLWSQWDFGRSDEQKHLTRIETSELDYAIVGYFKECLNPTQVDSAVEDIHKSLFSLDEQWHSSITKFRTATYRLLSQLQPYAHASRIGTAGDWLRGNQQYHSFDVSTNNYAAILFGLFMPPKIEFIEPEKLSAVDLEACLTVLAEGKAVDVESARSELPRAVRIAVHRDADKIVALGAVKRSRPSYAEDKASLDKANYPFDYNINEVGYVAVLKSHRGEKLSCYILKSLLADFAPRPVFATTFNERMKFYLKECGFERKGQEWQNTKHQRLSLWITTAPK